MNYKQILSKIRQSQPIDKSIVSALYILSVKSQVSSLIAAVLVTLFLYIELSYSILIWGGVLFAFTLFRLYSIYLFKTDEQRYSAEIWYRVFMITSLLTSTILSLLGTVYIHYVNDFYQLFIVIILVGATSISTTSLSSDYRIAIAYISIILIPLIVSIAMIQFKSHYILALLLIMLFIAQITMIFNNYRQQKKIKELFAKNKSHMKYNEELLKDNKQFIADMVHQIRTPLTVIMTNTSLIEMKDYPQTSGYTAQINSAINMLSNSYEDLSYMISNDALEYKPIKINFTDFLHHRIDFFEVIARANEKTILSNIANDVSVTMNDTELERLIDNNLSNAIKHSVENSVIEVSLDKNHSEIILNFISKGKNINDVALIFDKNYTETNSAKRSLGLGLHMVKSICEKNGIDYSVHSADGINKFTYVFKA